MLSDELQRFLNKINSENNKSYIITSLSLFVKTEFSWILG